MNSKDTDQHFVDVQESPDLSFGINMEDTDLDGTVQMSGDFLVFLGK